MLMRHARLHLRAIPPERRSIEARATTRMGQRRIERDGAGRGGSGDASVLCATQVPNVEHVLATKHCERPDDVGVLFVTQIFYYNFRCRFNNIHFTPISVPGGYPKLKPLSVLAPPRRHRRPRPPARRLLARPRC